MANQTAVKMDKVAWRVLILALTRPMEKRDLRTAQRCMTLDKSIKDQIDPYDADLEALVARARKLGRRKHRLGELEFETQMAEINDSIEELDEQAAGEVVEILFSIEDGNFIDEQFKDLVGIPADRKQGAIYQRIGAALKDAQKVPVVKAVEDPTPIREGVS